MSLTVLEDEFWDVYLTSSSFLSLLGPVIENYRKETGGVLVGSISREWISGYNRPVIKIHSVFPSITANASSKEWNPNNAALNRIKGYVSAFSLEILGEYHSHPNGGVELSEGDKEYIEAKHRTRMSITSDFLIDEEDYYLTWLELVISVKKKTYQREQKPTTNFSSINGQNNCPKIKGIIKIGEKQGFEITIAAWGYFVNPEDEEDQWCGLGVFSEICNS